MLRASVMAVLLAASVFTDGGLNRVRAANAYAAEAQAAYERGDDGAAIVAYERLAALAPLAEETRLNLAHAYFRAGRRSRARALYASLSTSQMAVRRATALGQLGLLSAVEQDYDRALTLLRRALRANPQATTIRYNYEVLARWLESGPDGPPPNLQPPPGRPKSSEGSKKKSSAGGETGPDGPANAPGGQGAQPGGGDRPTENGQRQESRNRGNQPGEQRGENNEADPTRSVGADGRAGNGTDAADAATRHIQTLRARPTNADLPADQARMLLDAMRAAEEQYLQQISRPRRKTADPNKPDW